MVACAFVCTKVGGPPLVNGDCEGSGRGCCGGKGGGGGPGGYRCLRRSRLVVVTTKTNSIHINIEFLGY